MANRPKNHQDNYIIRDGMSVDFRIHPSKSVGYIELGFNPPKYNPGGEKEKEFDEALWDSQFLRYVTILDTDQENYIALYSCLESANFFDLKENKLLNSEEAWNKAIKSKIDDKKQPPVEYDFDENMKVEPVHFENIKILWLPTQLPGGLDE